MSTSNNPFMNNNNGTFTNTPSQPSALFRNNTQTNSISNVLNGQSKEGSSNSIFKQKIDSNPFKEKLEPNSNNLNIKLTQDSNSQKTNNPFFGLNTQQNNEVKNSNDININKSIKNNTLLNINSINDNNNISQNSSNIFNINNKGIGNILNNNNNKDKEKSINILSTINTKVEKKEEKNILVSQPNNLLNISNNIINNKNQNNEQIKNSLLSQNQKPENILNNSQIPILQKKDNPKVNEFINNLLAEDKIIFTEEEKKEFEKKQLSHKLNGEITKEFELMLLNQEEKFKKFTNNDRILENKIYTLYNINKNNSSKTLNNENKCKKLFEKVKLTEAKVSKLNLNMINKDASVSGGLDYLKKNLNNNNTILSSMVNTNFEKNNPFYKELSGFSEKIRKIDNNINIIWNSINRNQENKKEINYFNVKEKEKNNINIINIDNNIQGIFIEKNNVNNNNNEKIYIEQKDINNIFNECFDGLYSLKNLQDEIDSKYNILKNKLNDKIKERNNYFAKRNIENEEINL